MSFVRKRIADLVQNYIDRPSNWELDNNRDRIVNKVHGLYVEFTVSQDEIYKVNAIKLFDHDELTWREKRLLIKTFKPLLEKPQVPTLKSNPEAFI